MAKKSFKPAQWLSRLVKTLVAVLLVPPVIGLARAIMTQLDGIGAPDASSCLQWFLWGMVGYIGVHLLLYRPKGLFRLNHSLLQTIAVWLFGGQVSTVGSQEAAAAAKVPKGKSKRGKDGSEEGGGGDATPHESTLVVISPYLVPLYVILLSGMWWLAGRGGGSNLIHGIASAMLGVALSFHLAMTGEHLQERADQVPFETRLMTLTIAGLASLAITTVCLPLALASFSIPGTFAAATAKTHSMYAAIFETLF